MQSYRTFGCFLPIGRHSSVVAVPNEHHPVGGAQGSRSLQNPLAFVRHGLARLTLVIEHRGAQPVVANDEATKFPSAVTAMPPMVFVSRSLDHERLGHSPSNAPPGHLKAALVPPSWAEPSGAQEPTTSMRSRLGG